MGTSPRRFSRDLFSGDRENWVVGGISAGVAEILGEILDHGGILAGSFGVANVEE